MRKRAIQDFHEVWIHERFAASERGFRDPHFKSFINEGLRVFEGNELDPIIAGPGSLQAERARQIAVDPRVEP